jgi:hypothetical protein
MANPEHLAKLKEGVEAWNRWRQERTRGVVLPDLSKANLTKAKPAKAHLNVTKLIEAKLIEADLRRAKLGGAILSEADLRGANPGEARFRVLPDEGSYHRVAG